MNSMPALLLSISSTIATGACARASPAKPTTAKQHTSEITGTFILQIPHALASQADSSAVVTRPATRLADTPLLVNRRSQVFNPRVNHADPMAGCPFPCAPKYAVIFMILARVERAQVSTAHCHVPHGKSAQRRSPASWRSAQVRHNRAKERPDAKMRVVEVI